MIKAALCSFLFGALGLTGLGQTGGVSDPLNQWTLRAAFARPLPEGARIAHVAFGQGVFVGVGDFTATYLGPSSGEIWTTESPQNRPWVSQLRVDLPLRDVLFNAGLFVAVGNGGMILSSVDGIHWTPRDSGTNEDLTAVTHGNDFYVAVGFRGTILRSTDGIQWQTVKSPSNNLDGIAFGNGRFLAVGGSPKVIISTNAADWSKLNQQLAACRT